MKDSKIRDKLIELGVEKLADVLLNIAEHNKEILDLVEHIIAAPSENVQRFKKKLHSLRRRSNFIGWSESRYFAQELEALLDDLEAGAESPEIGLELISDFFESDGVILEQCDDSNGYVGDVFQYDGRELFIQFASQCNNKAPILQQLIELHRNDEYGVRFCLIENTGKYLSEKEIRHLIDKFGKESDKCKNDSFEKRHWQLGMEALAKELKDGKLYEKICLQRLPELSSSVCMNIARVYFEADDTKKALEWINKIEKEDHFRVNEKDELLLAIYKKLDDKDKIAEIAWILFRRHRTKDSLSELLDIIGLDKKDKVIREECTEILSQKDLSLNDAEFLIRVELFDEADTYILAHREQLNGNYYGSLLPLATELEKHDKQLSSSVIYRALLDSILERAQSKYYHHGVQYLKKLDKLASCISDWGDCGSHQEYLDDLRQEHNRKYAFWNKYNL